jgi:hypothetical protein
MAIDVVNMLWAKNVSLPQRAGVFGLQAGSGPLAGVIRHATESPVGHAVMYIGAGQIVQARWPKVIISAAPTSNVIWAYGQPLTLGQSSRIVRRARQLVGDGYDILAYPIFAAAVFKAAVIKDAAPLLKNDRWRVCSALVVDCDEYAGVDLTALPDPNLVPPSALLNLGVANGWFNQTT